MEQAHRSKLLVLLLVVSAFLSACGIKMRGASPFEDLTFSNGYRDIAAEDGRIWTVQFEYPLDSEFSGVVRHVSRWRDSSVPFMTHDILVTTGDFANPDIVSVSVLDHKFFYRYPDRPPGGTINLLHIFPASEEVLDQLSKIEKWDEVSVVGREIYKINLYDAEGQEKGFFMDMGCNTILVTSVVISP